MKSKWEKINEKIKLFWLESKKGTKFVVFGSLAILIVLVFFIVMISTKVNYVPLYANVSLEEVGQIKTELDTRKIPYEITDSGTTINVPLERRQEVLVELAEQKIPSSGNIDYSFFSENVSWGITENEFNMIKLDAMQTELGTLIRGIEGVEDANVLINLPEQSVFVTEVAENASVAIMLKLDYGYEFKDNQIEALYHLIARALPNLEDENISIIDQYSNQLNKLGTSGSQDLYTNQQNIKRDIEKDVQYRLQQMLSTMIGLDSVMVSVTADIDFKSENRVEDLVEPVDVENIEGLPVSIENIKETFAGNRPDGGVVGTGEEDVTNYPTGENGDNGDYELTKDTINYEFNRIHKEIVESPYRLRDLGIQVVVDNVRSRDGDTVEYLSQQELNTVEEGIASILNSIITTSIDKDFGEIEPAEKISIVFQEFSDKEVLFPNSGKDTIAKAIPMYIYITGAILFIIIVLLLLLLLRSRKRKAAEQEADYVMETVAVTEEEQVADIPTQPLSEVEVKKQQLESMVKEQPEDFTKLLRSWMSDD